VSPDIVISINNEEESDYSQKYCYCEIENVRLNHKLQEVGEHNANKAMGCWG
jgi:hypothetical protein